MKERGKGLRRTGIRRAAAAAPGPGRGGRVLAKGMRCATPAAAGLDSALQKLHHLHDSWLILDISGPARPAGQLAGQKWPEMVISGPRKGGRAGRLLGPSPSPSPTPIPNPQSPPSLLSPEVGYFGKAPQVA